MRLPLAARGDDFADELRRVGVQVPDAPDLYEIVAAVTESIDLRMPNNRGRTDLGEMAQMAAAESLTGYVGVRLRNLFDVAPEDVRDEFARLATATQFGRFARDFFARFTARVLDYFLDRTLSQQAGTTSCGPCSPSPARAGGPTAGCPVRTGSTCTWRPPSPGSGRAPCPT